MQQAIHVHAARRLPVNRGQFTPDRVTGFAGASLTSALLYQIFHINKVEYTMSVSSKRCPDRRGRG